jgi:hypothetical protein
MPWRVAHTVHTIAPASIIDWGGGIIRQLGNSHHRSCNDKILPCSSPENQRLENGRGRSYCNLANDSIAVLRLCDSEICSCGRPAVDLHWRSREVTLMFPTFVRLSKASRLPLTPKRGNKDYYKGKITSEILSCLLKDRFDDSRDTTGVPSWRTSHWDTGKARCPRKGEVQAFG